jgi:glycosyltransferase involved in cell wall biosynthesis
MHHHILLIDDRVPDPQFGAGFPRAYRLLLSLVDLGHKIHFFPNVKESINEINIKKLEEYNIHVTTDISQIPDTVDVIIASRPHNAHYHLPVAKFYLPNAKVIYDTEALWYRRYDLQLSITGKLPSWAYRYDELGMARAADLCFVVNNTEKQILEEAGAKKVAILAHALDPFNQGRPFPERSDVLVVGGKLEEDSSNEDGLWEYLINSWDEVRVKTNGSMNVTGQVTSPRLRNSNFSGVHLLGHVDNLRPLYESHRIFVAATRFATGIPWKVHEAMAYGIPCVISRLLADQLGVTDGQEALVANNWNEFVTKSVDLYTNREKWEEVRSKAFGLVRRDCDPEKFKNTLQANLDGLFA